MSLKGCFVVALPVHCTADWQSAVTGVQQETGAHGLASRLKTGNEAARCKQTNIQDVLQILMSKLQPSRHALFTWPLLYTLPHPRTLRVAS